MHETSTINWRTIITFLNLKSNLHRLLLKFASISHPINITVFKDCEYVLVPIMSLSHTFVYISWLVWLNKVYVITLLHYFVASKLHLDWSFRLDLYYSTKSIWLLLSLVWRSTENHNHVGNRMQPFMRLSLFKTSSVTMQ